MIIVTLPSQRFEEQIRKGRALLPMFQANSSGRIHIFGRWWYWFLIAFFISGGARYPKCLSIETLWCVRSSGPRQPSLVCSLRIVFRLVMHISSSCPPGHVGPNVVSLPKFGIIGSVRLKHCFTVHVRLLRRDKYILHPTIYIL